MAQTWGISDGNHCSDHVLPSLLAFFEEAMDNHLAQARDRVQGLGQELPRGGSIEESLTGDSERQLMIAKSGNKLRIDSPRKA
eukprot:1797106-Prorocentrum_lima.AAC.1